jgi:hypothetical protein
LLNFFLFVNFLLNFGGFWRASFANWSSRSKGRRCL